jgi:hypothetical protein
MAYESTMEKGRKFQNHQEGKHFDKVRGEEKAAKTKKAAPAEESDSEQPIHEVVKEHGPAHKTEIEKEGESYSVHSHHEDGHKHTSEGHSLHEAHDHSMMAHGEAGGMEGEPDGDEMGAAMPPMGGQGATPPGM